MVSFYKEATKSSPEVIFDPEALTLTIKGESYPENSFEFYKPVFEMLENAIAENNRFKLIIDVTYLNTSSTKAIMNFLDLMNEAYHEDKDVSVDWYYEEDNEHSYELALDFEDFVEMPFNIIPLKE